LMLTRRLARKRLVQPRSFPRRPRSCTVSRVSYTQRKGTRRRLPCVRTSRLMSRRMRLPQLPRRSKKEPYLLISLTETRLIELRFFRT
jgi:hypothetical protein